ncbi:MAG TPA: hypothetical protein VEB64_08205 [Azospirillaceae bacterium]|nr:hypothetical protein [Azospirillaceae bacterium]
MLKKVFLAVLMAGLVSGCSNLSRQEQRTLSGGAIGAAGGAAISAIAGGNLLVGGLIGAAGGAAVGALTNTEVKK